MKKRKHSRLFAAAAALFLSLAIMLAPSLTAEAAGRVATVELRFGQMSLGMVQIAEQEILNVTIPGYPTIQMQWTDPSYIEVAVPGQQPFRLTVPGSANPGGGGWGDELPVPTGEETNPTIDQSGLQQGYAQNTLSKSADYDFLYFLGDVSNEQYQVLAAYLNAVIASDPNLIQTFVANGWRIVLTTVDLDAMIFGGTTDGVEGATYFPQKTIYVNAGEYSFCVVHELGHYLDYVSGFASDSIAFANLYNAEGANLTAYGRTSANEFFAEIFSYLVLDPNTAYTYCPQASAFVQSYRY